MQVIAHLIQPCSNFGCSLLSLCWLLCHYSATLIRTLTPNPPGRNRRLFNQLHAKPRKGGKHLGATQALRKEADRPNHEYEEARCRIPSCDQHLNNSLLSSLALGGNALLSLNAAFALFSTLTIEDLQGLLEHLPFRGLYFKFPIWSIFYPVVVVGCP